MAIITSVILFSSCSKDKNPQPSNNSDKVKTYTEEFNSPTEGNSVVTFNLGYDANNRVTSITSATSPADKFVISYTSGSKYSMDLYSSANGTIHEDFFLNSNSLVDSTLQFTDDEDTTTEKYFYNSANQLIKLNEYDYYSGPELYNTTHYTYDNSGNLLQSSDTNGQVDTYDYYTDLVYVLPQIFPGTGSPKKMNLVKTHTVTSNGYPVGSSTTTYTFDSSNRISTIIETADDGTVVTKTFTYF